MALAAGSFSRGRITAWPALPAGDILVPVEALARRLHSNWVNTLGPALTARHTAMYAFRWHEPHEVRLLQHVLDGGERWWGRWSVCGLLFLCMLIAAALMIPGTG